MTFSLHQGGVVLRSQNTHSESSNISPLAHILYCWYNCALYPNKINQDKPLIPLFSNLLISAARICLYYFKKLN